jgi:hypothetical protein
MESSCTARGVRGTMGKNTPVCGSKGLPPKEIGCVRLRMADRYGRRSSLMDEEMLALYRYMDQDRNLVREWVEGEAGCQIYLLEAVCPFFSSL